VNSPVALITGALTGIGRATALAFADQHVSVVVSGRHSDKGKLLADELRGRGAKAEFVQADVRYDEQVRNLVDAVVARFGRLDVAVNNAGTDGEFSPISEITPEQYSATYDTNVLGTLLSMKHELRVMQPQGFGSIINVTSIYGDKGFPTGSLYVSSKHAIIGLTRSAALEAAADGVRVNAVGPGPVQTDMLERVTGHNADAKAAFLATVPVGRAGTPSEIAAAITFLASPEAGFLTGQTIYIDGGMKAA
jgi:NAD(P)-dependent dehydrogenase (short-subunit alcohol dehydrogenase family)